MDPAERLVAYQAGELSADERLEVEADLARDGKLREDLAALRRADRALDAVPPTSLPGGADERLFAALSDELDAQLGPTASTERDDPGAAPAATFTSAAPCDELAERRRWRGTPPLAALGGLAAAVVAVAVVAVGPLGLGGAGDDAASDGVTTMSEDVGERQPTTEGAPAPDGPVLRASDRALDAEGADELLRDPAALAFADQVLPPSAAGPLARRYAAGLGATSSAGSDQADDMADAQPDQEAAPGPEEGAGTESDPGSDPGSDPQAAPLRTTGDIDAEARADVARCLEVVLAGGGEPVPVLAELVAFGDRPAIAYVLVGASPTGGAFDRPEVWIVDREDCGVRYFSQG